MIIAVGAGKGVRGATTLALTLGIAWPSRMTVVMEADPSGADLPFRVRHGQTGRSLTPEPSVLSLATDARTGIPSGRFGDYAQPTSLGVRVIPGPMTTPEAQAVRGAWAGVAGEAARWDGLVVADLGRLGPGHDAMPIATAATAVLLLTGVDLASLYRLRRQVAELAHVLGDPSRRRHPLGVVVMAPKRHGRQAVTQVTQLLESNGSPVPVLGSFAHDPDGAAALAGGRMNRSLRSSALMASARALVDAVTGTWPELAVQPAAVESSGAVVEGRAP